MKTITPCRARPLALTLAVVAACAAHWPAAAQHLHGPELHNLLEQEKQTQNVYRAYYPSAEIARKAAISFHGQLLESDFKRGFLVMELDAADMDRLRPFGFRFELATDYIELRNR
ncbi:MAG: hypothetical protein Q8M96_00865, partial [Rubrivivax sp.]|nr:hypothetical protein [Rubrivivax sp.]